VEKTHSLELSKLIQEPEIREIRLPEINNLGHELFMLRLDLMHEWAGGNKYFKLKKNIETYYAQGCKGIISFGGAYSNHLTALAWLCKALEIPLTIFIRGEKTLPLNARIFNMQKFGANIRYLSRELYKQKEDINFLQLLLQEYEGYWLIPEGGKNKDGIEGCAEIAQFIGNEFTNIFLPVGTAGTISGIAAGLATGQKLWGVSVIKGIQGIEKEVDQNITNVFQKTRKCALEIIEDAHYGGYAKMPPALMEKIAHYEALLPNIRLEPVYVAKAFLGMLEQLKKGKIIQGGKLLFLHTGGWFQID
jgi:1-aminocyclopropane-1-carboxylate deaminase